MSVVSLHNAPPSTGNFFSSKCPLKFDYWSWEMLWRISSCCYRLWRACNCWMRLRPTNERIWPSIKLRLDDVRLQLRLLWRSWRERERERERERTCVNAAAKDSIAMYTQMSGHCWRPFDNNFPSSVAARFPPIATSWFDQSEILSKLQYFSRVRASYLCRLYKLKGENEFRKSMMSYILWTKCLHSSSFQRPIMRLNLRSNVWPKRETRNVPRRVRTNFISARSLKRRKITQLRSIQRRWPTFA
jgi:hypothetical protein